MKKKLVGAFYFKRTINGNLLGEFTNESTSDIVSESAKPIKQTTDYDGEYNSIWMDSTIHSSRLIIQNNGNKYTLEWTELNNPSYKGEGFIVDGMLTGHYKMV